MGDPPDCLTLLPPPHPPVSITEDVADDVGQLGGGRHVEEDGDQEEAQQGRGGRLGGRDRQVFVRDLSQLGLVPEDTVSDAMH